MKKDRKEIRRNDTTHLSNAAVVSCAAVSHGDGVHTTVAYDRIWVDESNVCSIVQSNYVWTKCVFYCIL